MSEAAVQYFDMMELALEETETEAFGAYYVYDMDTTKNTYSIGVYGN